MTDPYFVELFKKEKYAYEGTPLNSPERLEEYSEWTLRMADTVFDALKEAENDISKVDIEAIYRNNMLSWLTLEEFFKIQDIRQNLYEKEMQRSGERHGT